MRFLRSRWLFGVVVLLGIALAASLNVAAADLQSTRSLRPIDVRAVQVKLSGTSEMNVVAISAALHNHEAVARDLTVDLDIRNADGKIVHRASRRGVRLASGQSETVHWFWSVPQKMTEGDYIVDMSIYGPNWSPLYAQVTDLATFSLEATKR